MKHFFIPGFGTKAFVYQPLLDALPDLQLVPAWDFSYESVKSFLNNQQRQGPIVLSGWSLGSLFALRYALENPEGVIAMHLTGFTARFTEKPGYANGIQARSLQSMIRLVPKNAQAVMKNFYQSAFNGIPDSTKLIEFLLHQLPETEDLLRGLTELEQTDCLDQLHSLTVPVKIFQGLDDPITPLKGARLAMDLLTNATLETPKGGHAVFLEDVSAYARCYKDFLCTIKK